MIIKKLMLSLCLCLAVTPVHSSANFWDYFKSAPVFDPYDTTTQAQLVALFGACAMVLGSVMAARDKHEESPVSATIETVAGLCYIPMGALMIIFAGDIIDAKGTLVQLIKEEFAKQRAPVC